MPQEALIVISSRHMSHYERLKSYEVAKFDSFLKQMDRDLRLKLSGLEIESLTRSKIETQIKQINKLLTGTYNDYNKVWIESITDASLYEAGFEGRSLEKVVEGVNFKLPSDSQITAAVFNTPLGDIGGASGGSLLEPFFDDMSATSIKRIEGAVRLGYAEGQTTQEIIRRIRGTKAAGFSDGLLATSKRDAETITRTALQHAAQQARNEVWKKNSKVVDKIKIVATLGMKTSVQCFPEQTQVQLAGELENVFRANYSGEVVIITTASGKKLEGTLNHPVLTLRGFLPLHELKPNDKVINATFDNGVEILGDENVSMPANIGQLFDSLNKPSVFNVFRKAASAIDFYGDGKRMNGEVDIVSVNGHLRSDGISSLSQKVKNMLFGFVKYSGLLSAFSYLSNLNIWKRPTKMTSKTSVSNLQMPINKALGATYSLSDLNWLKPLIKEFESFGSVSLDVYVTLASLKARHDAMLLKQAGDGCSGNSEVSTNLSGANTFAVKADNVISAVREFRNCHVYTLQSSLGFYTAEGIIVKNCRSLDGQIFPIDSGPRPPFHPRCRTGTVAVLNKKYAKLAEGRTRSTRDPKTGKVGKTSATTTYYDWLKRQPASVQNSIIGPTRGKLLRNGGISSNRFAELQLGKNFEPLTLDEMKKLEPIAFEKAGL